MKQYRNYIFDLYGTLINIHTNQKWPYFWKKMAEYYNCFGTSYTGESLRGAYERICREKDALLGRELGTDWPEIDIAEVFLDLLGGKREGISDMDQWVTDTARFFRILSRFRYGLYPGTLPALTELKERGRGIYLLSNAQRVFTEPEMKVKGIWDIFDGIFISSDRRIRKPDPAFMKDLLAAYDLDPKECVMIGNEYGSDMRIAAECGVDGIFLNTDGNSPERCAHLAENLGFFPPVIEDLRELLTE
ncbi:MAG: HAD family hydrolase [Lachnospiraceae bacterium]|nr:HAD family hydrolase [Lachnospiraceae bacterium]